MRKRPHLLILGGTAEARDLADRATALFGRGLSVTTSLAGRTRNPAAVVGELRVGGFGGAEGLTAYLRETIVDLVVDATHPFATRISAAAIAAARSCGVPLLALVRPAWKPRLGDRWIEVASAAAAAAILPTLGRRAFLTIGHAGLEAFCDVAGVHFLIRLVEPPASNLPLASHELLFARGPFTTEAERRIMADHAIDVLVAKASGGATIAAKIDAARALGIPVVMLRRPEYAPADCRASVDDALAWIVDRLRQAVEVAR